LQALTSAHPARAIHRNPERFPTYCTISGRAMPVMRNTIAIHSVLLIVKQVPKQLKTPTEIAAAQLFSGNLPYGQNTD
jgi:hypothetical protein